MNKALSWQNIKQAIGVFFRHFILIIWCATTIFPFLWSLLTAFKNNNQIFIHPFSWPNPVIADNFPQIFRTLDIPTGFMNSIIYSAVTVIIVTLLSSMVGFYLSKCTRNRILHTYFITGIMIPIQAIIVPLFINIRNIGLGNTRAGIIIVYIVYNLSFSILIMTEFIRSSVPDEIIEASVIDGCKPLAVFFRIVMPLSKPGIATIGTFIFINVWNEFLCALIFLAKNNLKTLNLTTFRLRGQYSSEYGLIAAGVIVLIIPAMVVYALFQEQVVKGLTAGAVKG